MRLPRGLKGPSYQGVGVYHLASYHPPDSITWTWVVALEPKWLRFTWWSNNGYGRYALGPVTLLTQEAMPREDES